MSWATRKHRVIIAMGQALRRLRDRRRQKGQALYNRTPNSEPGKNKNITFC